MTIIAHLTDPHLLEFNLHQRTLSQKARLSFLSLGRTLNPEERKQRFVDALCAARYAKADHVIITGDLTEDGTISQFETVAETLANSKIPPSAITLVPGNHDIYADPKAWDNALEGPLKAYKLTSTHGRPVGINKAVILPISTLLTGTISKVVMDNVKRLAIYSDQFEQKLIIAMHHAPYPHWIPILQWIEGLQGVSNIADIIKEQSNIYVLHGHSHKKSNKLRAFSAAAIVDNKYPLRLYEVSSFGVSPINNEIISTMNWIFAS